MTTNMNFQPDFNEPQRNTIKVIGVGGGGSNAVNHMFKHGIEGVDFYICNTDNQALRHSNVPNRYQLGGTGLGAGSLPEIGEKAAIDSSRTIEEILDNETLMVFITAGMGGGTGTGAAPVIAKIAKDKGILTVGIVTLPFIDEGPKRNNQAQEGLEKLRPNVDALLTICNDRIVDMYEDLTISEAFSEADEILCTAAKGIAEIIFKPGLINVDFMDVKTAMENSGQALMGTGIANGESRAENAVKIALNSPLLDNTKILGASHLLINVSYGSKQPTMKESRVITSYLQSEAGNEAHLKMGVTHDETLGENLSVTVIATGFSSRGTKTIHTLSNAQIESIQPVQSPSVIEIETISPVMEANQFMETMNNEMQPTTITDLFKNENQYNQEPEYVNQPIAQNQQSQLVESQIQYRQHQPQNFQSSPTRYEHSRMERENILDTDMNIPAYQRKNVPLFEGPQSTDTNISKFSLTAEATGERDFAIRPNRHLHDNVD
jgi:cell division protein FtsZ